MNVAALGQFCRADPRPSLLHQHRHKTSQHHSSHSRTSSMAALSYPQPIVSKPAGPHTATVIMLHGLGDDGSGWSSIAGQFKSDLPHVKFIFPTAPQRAITLNFGMRMTGWYDIKSLEDINQLEDEAGLLESKRYIEELVQAEAAAGIPSSRVAVAGFSQGGATSLLMLRSDLKLAAVIGLSAYMPLRNKQPIVSEANKGTPVLMCHGDQDPIVGYDFGQQTAEQLKQAGMDAEFVTFRGMGHSACPEELQAVLKFLKAHLE